jgi:FixJ family two-component response regulator
MTPCDVLVMITGYATADHQARAAEVGAAAFLAKPFDASELMECVRQSIGRSVARGEPA